MTTTSPRSRFKSKPPKILAWCLKFIILIAFIILLIAQLRAIELPPGDERLAQTTGGNFIGRGEYGTRPSLGSIDRDDRGTTTFIESGREKTRPDGPFSPSIDEVHAKTEPPLVPLVEPQSLASLPIAALSPSSNEISGAESVRVASLEQRATTDSVLKDYLEMLSNTSNRSQPSLEQLTAAGTATGLLVQDLMAQANDLENQLAYERSIADTHNGRPVEKGPRVGPYAMLHDDGSAVYRESNGPLAQLMDSATASMAQQQEHQRSSGQDPSSNSDGIDSLSAPSQGNGLEPVGMNGQPLSAQAAVNRMLSRPPAHETEDLAKEHAPSNEEASPDSMESLMGADGTDLDGDGPISSQADVETSGSQPLNTRNNYLRNDDGIDGNSDPSMITGAQQFVAASAPGRYGNSDDDDDEEDPDDDSEKNKDQTNARNEPALVTQTNANHIQSHDTIPVVMSTRYQQMPSFREASGLNGGELEHNLVAPMRESLVDLNAAAGHYYGKKKKKKIKKVVIKKKKKKKKKKKYKKIKIIEIKKKKKVKKKKLKKHHHHHHDHGKYYMYAKVPKKKSWEFGFKKGNKKHWIERHEKGHKNKFKTKVMWYDKKSKGKGMHIWDYNHHDKKKKHH